MKTYLSFYQNEVRAVEISVLDQDDQIFYPSSATAYVVNNLGTVVQPEQPVMVTGNSMYILITTATTLVPGTYEIVWKMTLTADSHTYIYYHKTTLEIEKL